MESHCRNDAELSIENLTYKYIQEKESSALYIYIQEGESSVLCLLLHETCISKPHKDTTELGKIDTIFPQNLYSSVLAFTEDSCTANGSKARHKYRSKNSHILIKSRLIILLLTLYLLSGKYFQ